MEFDASVWFSLKIDCILLRRIQLCFSANSGVNLWFGSSTRHFYSGVILSANQEKKITKFYLTVTYFDEVDEVVVILAVKCVSYSITALTAALWNSAPLRSNESSISVKEIIPLVGFVYHIFWRHTNSDDEKFKEFLLVNRRKEWSSCHKLSQNTAKRPHVHSLVVWEP